MGKTIPEINMTQSYFKSSIFSEELSLKVSQKIYDFDSESFLRVS